MAMAKINYKNQLQNLIAMTITVAMTIVMTMAIFNGSN
jgi:membrane protease subunit (stomatin/prohibitin family)